MQDDDANHRIEWTKALSSAGESTAGMGMMFFQTRKFVVSLAEGVATASTMGTVRAVIVGCVVLPACAQVSWGSPPPPPRASLVRSVEAASCGPRQKTTPEQVPVMLAAITPESIGVHDGRLGKLTWQWGVHISSSDQRVAKVTGLLLDADLGLVATTENRDWLALDLEHGTLDGIKTVGVATMRGAPGRPTAPTSLLSSYLVSFPDQGVIERFASKCGFAAEAVPALDVSGRPFVSAMTGVALSYVGLAGDDGSAVKTALVLPYERRTVSLGGQDIPSLPGFRLVALSNPSQIVPFLLALWGSANSGEARLQQIHVVAWDDVHGPGEKSDAVDLAMFSRTPAAMASALAQRTSRIWVFLTFDTPERGGFDIVGLSVQALRD